MKYSDLSVYIEQIKSFLDNDISVTDFERRYLHLFKQDETNWEGPEYEALNNLFSDVDAFCSDPELRDSEDLDEYQLREKSRAALNKLLTLNDART